MYGAPYGRVYRLWKWSEMVKIQQLKGGSLVICNPKEIARFKGWRKGDEIIFIEDRNTMRVMLLKKDEI